MTHTTNKTNNNNSKEQVLLNYADTKHAFNRMDKKHSRIEDSNSALIVFHEFFYSSIKHKLEKIKDLRDSIERLQLYPNVYENQRTPIDDCNSMISTIESKLKQINEAINELKQDNQGRRSEHSDVFR